MYNLSLLFIQNESCNFLKHINNDYETALFLCIKNGYWDLVEEIINRKYYDVNNITKDNNCLLFYIITNKNEKLGLKIINDNKNIINVNFINNENNTLLHLSISNGLIKLSLKILEIININTINKLNSFNDNILLLAIHLEYWDIINEIIKKDNINLNHINNNGDNALLLLCNLKKWNFVEILLKNPRIDKYYKNKISPYEIIKNYNMKKLLNYF